MVTIMNSQSVLAGATAIGGVCRPHLSSSTSSFSSFVSCRGSRLQPQARHHQPLQISPIDQPPVVVVRLCTSGRPSFFDIRICHLGVPCTVSSKLCACGYKGRGREREVRPATWFASF